MTDKFDGREFVFMSEKTHMRLRGEREVKFSEVRPRKNHGLPYSEYRGKLVITAPMLPDDEVTETIPDDVKAWLLEKFNRKHWDIPPVLGVG